MTLNFYLILIFTIILIVLIPLFAFKSFSARTKPHIFKRKQCKKAKESPYDFGGGLHLILSFFCFALYYFIISNPNNIRHGFQNIILISLPLLFLTFSGFCLLFFGITEIKTHLKCMKIHKKGKQLPRKN